MPIKLRGSDGIWKNVSAVKLRGSDGVWKNVAQAFIRGSDAIWKNIFSSTILPSTNNNSEITKSTNSTNWLITLTGKYYHWYNTDVLDYRFERSTDSGATWTTIKSGLDIVNPSIGSYDTVTHQLDDSPSDVVPNSTNLYRFIITGTKTSPYATADNESTEITVYGPEDVSLTVGTVGYTDVSFSWTASPNAQKYLVYKKLDAASSYDYIKVISGTSTTIDSLSSNTTYDFQVIPITGVSNTYRGYLGNPSYLNDITTQTAVTPTQITAPTKGSGTGKFGTAINIGSPGTYSNALNVDTRFVYISSATAPSNGTTTNLSNNQAHPHPVDQADFTHVSNRYYTQDDVTALDGTTHYYYYSQGITCYVDDISDTFDRSNSSGGLGTTSTGLLYDSNRSNYVNTWAVLSNKAYSSQSVSSNSPSNPMQAIEAGGRAEILGGLSYPNNGGGYGIAFWVTAANSWWAASTYYNQSSTSGTYCAGTGGTNRTGCPSIGTNVGDACGCTTAAGSEYVCSTWAGIDTNCPSGGFGTGPGQYCNCTDYSTSYYACTQAGSTGTSCTNSSNQTPGGVCNCTASTSYGCSASGGSNTTGCPPVGNNPGDACECSSVYTPAVPSTCSDGFTDYSFCPAFGSNEGQRCSASCTSTTTTTGYDCNTSVSSRAACGSYTSTYNVSTVGTRCSSCEGSPGSYSYKVVGPVTSTTYAGTLRSASSPAYTTYSWNTRTSTPTTTYSWSTRSNSLTTVTGKQWYTRDTSPTNYTDYSWNTIVSTAGTAYKSYIDISQSNGSSVVSQASLEVASSTSGYVNIPRLSMFTAGNSIYVSAYNGSTQIGNTLSTSGSKPTAGAGGVSVGLIKMRTPYNEAPYVDDLVIYPSV